MPAAPPAGWLLPLGTRWPRLQSQDVSRDPSLWQPADAHNTKRAWACEPNRAHQAITAAIKPHCGIQASLTIAAGLLNLCIDLLQRPAQRPLPVLRCKEISSCCMGVKPLLHSPAWRSVPTGMTRSMRQRQHAPKPATHCPSTPTHAGRQSGWTKPGTGSPQSQEWPQTWFAAAAGCWAG